MGDEAGDSMNSMEPIEITPEPVEAAYSWSENKIDNNWFARVTFKCPICGRRNVVLEKGPGKMPVPLTVKCKNKHECRVIPYRWNSELRRSL